MKLLPLVTRTYDGRRLNDTYRQLRVVVGGGVCLLPSMNSIGDANELLVSTIRSIDSMPLNELLNISWQMRKESRPPVFEAVYPSGTASISVTGSACLLQCPHCGGRYLEHMVPVGALDSVLERNDVKSILMSGGCTKHGQVPLIDHIDYVKDRISRSGKNIRVNAHPGVADKEDAARIGEFASVISYDFVLDDVTIQECFGFELSGEDYVNALRNLRKGTAKVVPHVLVGLYKGTIRGEYEAIEFLSNEGIKEIIIIVFIPTPGTRWEHLPPPDIDGVLSLLAWTRINNPEMKITLGCMRPHGAYREKLDLRAVKAGVDGIVLPHRRAIREAEEKGLEILRKEECCAFD